MRTRASLFRSVYGGGAKGGRWSEDAKLATAKRLLRMIVRVVFGPAKLAEYDAVVARLDSMTPEEREQHTKQQIRKAIDEGLL